MAKFTIEAFFVWLSLVTEDKKIKKKKNIPVRKN